MGMTTYIYSLITASAIALPLSSHAEESTCSLRIKFLDETTRLIQLEDGLKIEVADNKLHIHSSDHDHMIEIPYVRSFEYLLPQSSVSTPVSRSVSVRIIDGRLVISMPDMTGHGTITDMNGMTVRTMEIDGQAYVDISELPPASYILSAGNKFKPFKFVVK